MATKKSKKTATSTGASAATVADLLSGALEMMRAETLNALVLNKVELTTENQKKIADSTTQAMQTVQGRILDRIGSLCG
jgi:hypothetical protein